MSVYNSNLKSEKLTTSTGVPFPVLVVNTSTASRFAPRGAKIDQFTLDDQTIYKRALRWQRKKAVEFLLPGQRVAGCYVRRVSSHVRVLYSPKNKRAHFGNVMVCGSVWMCPICAAKITERRRLELENAKVEGLNFFMVTITLQHTHQDKLKNLIDDLSQAWRFVTAGRGWMDIKNKFQLVGSVTGKEVTYGIKSGWHPHLHILYYTKLSLNDINTDEIKFHIAERFTKKLKKMGRYASALHGVNVIKGDGLNNLYVAKMGLEDDKKRSWSLISELTKSQIKGGLMVRGEHYSPFQLIDLYMCGDSKAGQRFIEYSLVMMGRKQLTFSRGLRSLLGLDIELTDLELAEKQDDDCYLLSLLSADHWRIVLARGKRGTLLEVASTGDFNLFQSYCSTLGIKNLEAIQ